VATEMKQLAKATCKSCFISADRVALGAACNRIQSTAIDTPHESSRQIQATLAALMCLP